MGMVFGKINAPTPKYTLIKSTPEYEIRQYSPSVLAQVTYSPSTMNNNKDGGFSLLAAYIGVFGTPQNTTSTQIAMTAPVITKADNNDRVIMQFILPEEYASKEEAPGPVDERVRVVEEGERRYGVVGFSGVASDEVVERKVGELKGWLERDGFKVVGEFVLARFNPPWTLPMFRTNQVMIPVQSKSNQYPNTSLVQIEGVNTKEDVAWYQGKKMAYIYKAKTKKDNSHYRCIWGKVCRPHGNTGVVRAKFKSNLPPKSMGARVRVFMYPSNI